MYKLTDYRGESLYYVDVIAWLFYTQIREELFQDLLCVVRVRMRGREGESH